MGLRCWKRHSGVPMQLAKGALAMNKRALLSAALAVALLAGGVAGCAGSTDTADIFPMNAAAQRLGPVQASFVRTGTGRGPVTITMADGEVLAGEYRVAFGSAVGTAFSGGWSASAIVIRDGPVQFVTRGPKTQMLCRGTSSTMGHGNGECQTFEGAVWAISW
jgi:hypothetical protein